METTRQAKIARLLQKELSEILRLQTAKTHGTLVSVSAVRISPDLSIAKAYLSIFPSAKAQEILDNINRSAKTIRYELGQRVRLQLRKIPELAFYLDDSLDYIENIDNLLHKDGAAPKAPEAPDAPEAPKAEECYKKTAVHRHHAGTQPHESPNHINYSLFLAFPAHRLPLSRLEKVTRNGQHHIRHLCRCSGCRRRGYDHCALGVQRLLVARRR